MNAPAPMRFISLFSGIEAASVAWLPLGWECAAVAETDAAACAVLKHHYPEVPNLGDVTRVTAATIRALGHIDVVVFGFPCQDLSVAGNRAGLGGTRSGLFFDAIRIVRWSGARFALAENVPGLFSSNHGRDFAVVVDEMVGLRIDVPDGGWKNTGVAIGERGLLEWTVLDARWFRLAQRRRRVFALADFGDWRSRAPILLKRESLSGNPPPSREARETTPPAAKAGSRCCCISGCSGDVHARGICHKHYNFAHHRAVKSGVKLPPLPIVNYGDCSVSGCGRKAEKKTWCGTHYSRWKKTGSVHADRPITFSMNPEERFWAKVNQTEACWLWTGAISDGGYGIYFDPAVNRTVRAHRYAFEMIVGPIPEGLQLDHLCKVKACVRPEHLEPVTLQENTRRYWEYGDQPTVAPTLTGGADTERNHGKRSGSDRDTLVVASTGDISHCLNAGGMGRIDYESETLVTHSLSADGFDASEDGTGRGTPLVPIVFSCKDYGQDAGELSPTLRGMEFDASHANGGGQIAIAQTIRGSITHALTTRSAVEEDGNGRGTPIVPVTFETRFARNGRGSPDEIASPLKAQSGSTGKGDSAPCVASKDTAVRRLTPLECGRLQGFKDEYFSGVRHNGKPLSDGAIYKMLGNSMAVPVMAYIATQIQKVAGEGS